MGTELWPCVDAAGNLTKVVVHTYEAREDYRPVKVYRVHLMCECGGEMKAGRGEALDCNPPSMAYPHTCERCGLVAVRSREYPATAFTSNLAEWDAVAWRGLGQP